MERYEGPATIVQGAIEVKVHCFFEEFVIDNELPEWGGTYAFPDPAHRLDAGEATLVLPDGRRAEISLSVNHRNGDESGTFQGLGDLPA